MIKIICDICKKEADMLENSKENKELIPCNWLTISKGVIHNQIPGRSIIYSSGHTLHFCSQSCFLNFFFYLKPIKQNKK